MGVLGRDLKEDNEVNNFAVPPKCQFCTIRKGLRAGSTRGEAGCGGDLGGWQEGPQRAPSSGVQRTQQERSGERTSALAYTIQGTHKHLNYCLRICLMAKYLGKSLGFFFWGLKKRSRFVSMSNFTLKANFPVCPLTAAAKHDGSLGGHGAGRKPPARAALGFVFF